VRHATAAGADAAQVTAVDVDRFEIDFSERKVDLLRSNANETTTILVLRDGKRGSATLNGRDEEAVEAALSSALLAAEAGLADPANAVADAPSLPPRRHGAEAPDRDAMIATVLAYAGELNTRYPLIRTRNSTYAFFAKETAFANSLGVQPAAAPSVVPVRRDVQRQGRGARYFVQLLGRGVLRSVRAVARGRHGWPADRGDLALVRCPSGA
jgi:predicted Zn-dependent protease